MRGGAPEPPATDDLVRDPLRVPGPATDRLPVQRTALGAATVELPPRCRRGVAGCVLPLIGMRVVEHPLAPPAASALSSRQWRRVRWAVSAAVFVLLTAVGVEVGLQGAPAAAPASSAAPVIAAAPEVLPRLTPPPARPRSGDRAAGAHRRASAHGRAADPGVPPAPPVAWAR